MAAALTPSIAKSGATSKAIGLKGNANSTETLGQGAPRIIHLQRKPVPDHFSIEGLFANLRDAMKGDGFDIVQAVAPNHSKGIWPRVANIIWAARHQGDVNHVTGDDHYLALLLRRDRTVLTIHDCYALERLRGFKRWLMWVFWFELPIRRSAVVTVISEETKRQLIRHVRVNPEKIVVIPDAIAQVYRQCPKTFHSECPRILHIGTKENKNLSRLTQALKGIRCRLHVIGRMTENQIQEARSANIDLSTACNLTEEQMAQSYIEADMISFVSTYEGFGLPIVEANAVGRPVVTSNTSSMPEVAGNAACLVDPHDVASIRGGIRRVIEDHSYRDDLVRAGLRNADRFRVTVVAEQYHSLYRAIAHRAQLAAPA